MLRCICALALLTVASHVAAQDASGDDMDLLLRSKGLMVAMANTKATISTATPASSPRSSSTEPANGRASELLVHAMGFLDIPYQWGGTSAETGFDCSGFVRTMYEEAVGLVLPRQSNKQAEVTETIANTDLKPGDLVFFNTMNRAHSHVGIYVGDDKFIHSPSTGSRVRMEDFKLSYWRTRFDGARRVSLASLLQMLD